MKPCWFEKDFVSSEDNSPSNGSSDINSFNNEISPIQDSSPAQHTSQDSSTKETSTKEDQHHRPKWATQLFKDVHPNERSKTRTRISFRSEDNIVLLAHASTEPATFVEAVEHKEWQEAMINEYDSVLANGTWNLYDCPLDVKPIGCKWVYQIKYKPNGKNDKYKARLIAKAFAQQEGINYEETFALTAKWNTIRMVVNLVAQHGWKLHQMNVKSAFLNGDLK
jgi:hypothetical protein